MQKFIEKNRWILLITVSFNTFVSMIPALWSIFQRGAAEAYDITMTQSANFMPMCIAFYGVFYIIGGRMQEKISPMICAVGGAVVMSLGIISLAFWGHNTSALVLNISFCFLFGGGCGINNPALLTPFLRWYADKNGFAIGFTYAASAAMMVGATYFYQFLLDSYGYHKAIFIVGMLSLIISVICSFIIANPTQEYIDAKIALANEKTTSAASDSKLGSVDFTPKEMLSTKQYWCLLLAGIFSTPAYLLFASCIVTFGLSRGLSQEMAVTAIAVATAASAVSKFAVPALSDKFGRKQLSIAMCVLELGGAVMLLKAGGPLVIFAYTLVYAAYDGFYTMVPPFTNDLFGFKYSGTNTGLVTIFNTIASFGAPLAVTLFTPIFAENTTMYISVITAAISVVFILLVKIDTWKLKE